MLCCPLASVGIDRGWGGAGRGREGEIRLPDNGNDRLTLVLPEGQHLLVRALAARPKAEKRRCSGAAPTRKTVHSAALPASCTLLRYTQGTRRQVHTHTHRGF